MYDELVKRLRICPDYNEGCVNCLHEHDLGCRTTTMHEAADAIEELSKHRWIPMTDALPEESGYTIVFCADGEHRHVTFAKYQKTLKRWELSGARSYWRVLRWMPLPEPPKEDNQ